MEKPTRNRRPPKPIPLQPPARPTVGTSHMDVRAVLERQASHISGIAMHHRAELNAKGRQLLKSCIAAVKGELAVVSTVADFTANHADVWLRNPKTHDEREEMRRCPRCSCNVPSHQR